MYSICPNRNGGRNDAARRSAKEGLMAGDPDWVPPGVDTKRANVARVYDYWLGGSHNFLADQDVARAIAAVEPKMREIARANRQFLGRAVRYLARAGIRQFLDIGSGIPTEGNVHEVAQRADPAARVVYADVDQVAIAHSKAILAGNENATIVEADLREPEKILANDDVRRLIDLGQPGWPAAHGRPAFHCRRRGSLADRGHAARCARTGQLPRAGSRHI